MRFVDEFRDADKAHALAAKIAEFEIGRASCRERVYDDV